MGVIVGPKTKPRMGAADEIYALARRHGVSPGRIECDDRADDYARLSDAEADLDEPALLLIALERAGHLSGREAARLHGAYLHAKYE